jgi:hypothetical protein
MVFDDCEVVAIVYIATNQDVLEKSCQPGVICGRGFP